MTIIEKFREEYKKAYGGILSHPQLNEGNEWFESFIKREVEVVLKEMAGDELPCNKFLDELLWSRNTGINAKRQDIIEIAEKHGFNIN